MRKLKNSELGRLSREEYKNSRKTPIKIVLDNVRSMYNVGSIFRTADAFRAEGICLCGITGKPPQAEIHKSALGATETVEWKYYETTEEAVEILKRDRYKIYALEQTDESEDLKEFVPDKEEKYAFILGNELNGVSEEIISYCDGSIEIPQYGTKHSFNIAVSAGILLWDFFVKTASEGLCGREIK